MEIIKTEIEGLLIIKPKVFEDDRGYFYESYNEQLYRAHGIVMNFVQDNQSMSKRGVLRGLHFQNKPYAQGKLIRVLKGCVFEGAGVIRRKSTTYG
ncbi:MAG: dTDP-4-dehydrorhamnose 3,5-epimerase family protein, partial [Bacteroidetes bacterium]|nr:dTDP-4-dehydrorhamnose 3,5-epimerase family protein [Bacteroidota bacterium]